MNIENDNIRARVWFVAKVLLWYFFYQVASAFGFELLDRLFAYLNDGKPPFSENSVLAGSLFLSALLMTWHLVVFDYVKISKGIFSEVKPKILLCTVLLIFGSMYLFNVLMEWVSLPDIMEQTFMDMTDEPLGVLSMALLAPVVEELMFRGAIQGYLMRRCASPWTGILVTALIFGLIHMNPQQVVYATLLGTVFGWIYYRTRSLLPVIAGHILNNSVAVATMKVWGTEDMEALTSDDKLMFLPLLLVLSVVLVLLAIKINKDLPEVPEPWREQSE